MNHVMSHVLSFLVCFVLFSNGRFSRSPLSRPFNSEGHDQRREFPMWWQLFLTVRSFSFFFNIKINRSIVYGSLIVWILSTKHKRHVQVFPNLTDHYICLMYIYKLNYSNNINNYVDLILGDTITLAIRTKLLRRSYIKIIYTSWSFIYWSK